MSDYNQKYNKDDVFIRSMIVCLLAELNKKKHQDRFNELRAEIKQCKTKIKELFGDEFFTDKSPLWLSQKTGGCMFLSDWQGGVIEVKLEKIG